jgi:hypothetical protein
VEVHAESQSDDAVLQQFFRSLLAPDRKWIAEGQGEENAREAERIIRMMDGYILTESKNAR